jgi:hypothetical protein
MSLALALHETSNGREGLLTGSEQAKLRLIYLNIRACYWLVSRHRQSRRCSCCWARISRRHGSDYTPDALLLTLADSNHPAWRRVARATLPTVATSAWSCAAISLSGTRITYFAAQEYRLTMAAFFPRAPRSIPGSRTFLAAGISSSTPAATQAWHDCRKRSRCCSQAAFAVFAQSSGD